MKKIKNSNKKVGNSSTIPMSIQLENKLTNTQWQKGLAWRKEKVGLCNIVFDSINLATALGLCRPQFYVVKKG